MRLKKQFDPIREWAKKKGLDEKGDCKTECLKLLKDVGQLSNSILKGDSVEFIDAVGDCCIVLTNLAKMGGTSIEQCINNAYKKINNNQ